MNIHDITFDDMSNGTGLRVCLFLSGCEHHCPGCHNPITWDINSGILFTEWEEAELFEKLSKEHIEGLTVSGGDPLHAANRNEVGELLAKIKKQFPNKNIWLYTGYDMKWDEDLQDFIFEDTVANLSAFQIDWLNLVDVIVDGRFCEETRKQDLMYNRDIVFRGSSNQRYIDVKNSLLHNKVIDAVFCI